MNWILTRSMWIYHFAASGCNNCDMEIQTVLAAKYDIERLGVRFVGSIRHADCMLLTGPINTKSLLRLKAVFSQAPRPFFVIAAGTCALGLGIMRGSYNCVGPAGKHLPVDVFIPGCPPRPEAIIYGITRLTDKIKNKKPRRKKISRLKKL